ncbi:MAG: tRNA (N(6)-L-threonylcarbamoyladenosine(37)-C(2))-methylthiotransferase MtaB [Bdellovibrionaceae bacterium]|nr:tRNA (N(6)-L-threonylcarbamoyladenosine(37)-C(2))-methylthiotransferase MtaB [Pseudobdellovibrionaceae bacterium]
MDSRLNLQYHTFGCKVNTYDTGLIQKNLKNYAAVGEASVPATFSAPFSMSNLVTKPAVHILNTCAVTKEATQQAVRLIRKLKAKEPFSTIVVTGCAAQVDTESFSALPSVDLVVANSHKHELPFILDNFFRQRDGNRVFKSNIFKKEDLGVGGGEEDSHTRSFLKIQDGCNSFCTFCIIPYARGTSRSLKVNTLIQRIHELESQNVQEVVLAGVHIGDYYDGDEQLGLDGLIETILKKTKIQRIRLGSLEPIEVSDRLLELYQDPRLCAHFHMSIQSSQTNVLKEMKRKYTRHDVESALNRISGKVKNVYIGMDVIVGFPSETEVDFTETMSSLAQSPWTRIHVFPYSERKGTKAAHMETSVEFGERKRRAELMRALSNERLQAEALKQKNLVKKVLVLKKGQALSRDYWNVKLPTVDPVMLAGWVGQEIDVRVVGSVAQQIQNDCHLVGEVSDGF